MIYTSPIGSLRIGHRLGRLTQLEWVAPLAICEVESQPLDELATSVVIALEEYLSGGRESFDIPLDLSGVPPFQRRVLEELQRIPYGETRSYLEVATAIGNPRSSRAVGRALALNPIQIIIPCHRVITSRGTLGGYAGGVEAKRWLLNLESI